MEPPIKLIAPVYMPDIAKLLKKLYNMNLLNFVVKIRNIYFFELIIIYDYIIPVQIHQ